MAGELGFKPRMAESKSTVLSTTLFPQQIWQGWKESNPLRRALEAHMHAVTIHPYSEHLGVTDGF